MENHLERRPALYLAQGALIAAVYVVLTFVFAPISFGEIQVRVSEALTILPLFTPSAIPGLFVGCLIGNIAGGAMVPDIVFGSIATLLGAFGTYLLRKQKPFFGTLPPIIANTLIVPPVLRFAYGVPLSVPFLMLTVGIGEVAACMGLGLLLYLVLKRYRNVLFK